MPRSTAEVYHELTKYTPEGISRRGGGLDFDRQPVPFKEYATGERIPLTPFLPRGDELRDDTRLAEWRAGLSDAERALAEVSHLLYFTNGVTGMVPSPGQPLLMRAAPSAGALYPTEIYLVAHGHVGLEDGLYNYQVRDHSLVRFWNQDVWHAFSEATFDHPSLARTGLALVLTGVFYRSAWRYEDRAYRRVLLDSGHVLGNAALYAPQVGLRVAPIGGYRDTALNDLLFLEPGLEEVIAVAALLPFASNAPGPSALSGPVVPYAEAPEGQRLEAVHDAGKMVVPADRPLPPLAPRRPALSHAEALAAHPIAWNGKLGPTILERRSTRSYSGEGLTRAELAQLLDFAYLDDATALFAGELLQTYVAVRAVSGVEPGCYHYDPAARTLRQVRFQDLSEQVHYLALGQDLAALAGAVVFHTADLPGAIARYGDRAYRYLHLDAGHLGERLNVAAIRMGLGVSGIGGFFDDEVNELLGIPEDEAVVYITTLGRP
ncbi:MAG TPA: SagB/ThcOx family dehydrogenase [Oscillatoriaceae cyanobacterium]